MGKFRDHERQHIDDKPLDAVGPSGQAPYPPMRSEIGYRRSRDHLEQKKNDWQFAATMANELPKQYDDSDHWQ
jgi:hypothetical protein